MKELEEKEIAIRSPQKWLANSQKLEGWTKLKYLMKIA